MSFANSFLNYAEALPHSCVTDEPLIYPGRAQSDVAALGTHNEPLPDDRGDLAVHRFWKNGRATIFNVRITDTEDASYRNRDPAKILACHEKEKKSKYLEPCLSSVSVTLHLLCFRWMAYMGPKQLQPASICPAY